MDNENPFYEYNVKPKRHNPWRDWSYFDNNMWLILVLVVVILLAGLFVGAWYMGYTRATVKAQSTISQLRVENTQLSSEAESWKKKALASGPVSAEAARQILLADYTENTRVVTLEYPFSDCDRFANSQTISDWAIPFTEKAFTIKWSGTIGAGIDLSRVSIKAAESGEKLIITIPKARIYSYEVTKDSFELLDEQNNIYNPISLEDIWKLDENIEEKMKERAKDNGILRAAQENAQVFITNILRSSPEIGSYYELEFKLK